MMSCGSFALYPMMYYELIPQYLCLDKEGNWSTCEPEDFCGTDTPYKVDYSSNESLDNWVTDFGMECSPKYQFGLFGSLFFSAVVLSSIIFPPLADKLGRKPIGIIGLSIHLIFGLLTLMTKSMVAT